MSVNNNGYPEDLSCRKIFAFLEEGIIAKEESRKKIGKDYNFPISGSNDEEKVNRICVNYINQINNIAPSLYNESKGGFAVVVEEREINQEMTQQFLKENKDVIDQKVDELSQIVSLPKAVLRRGAIKRIMNKNKEFKEKISEKVRRTALFTLNIPPEQVGEGHIYADVPAGKIDKVFLPESMSAPMNVEKEHFAKYSDKIFYVTLDRTFSFKYGYELNDNAVAKLRNSQTMEIENIIGPNYESALANETGKATHMTSLFPIEEVITQELSSVPEKPEGKEDS